MLLFFKIFERNEQHAKTFAVFFPEMFVVHFVRTPDCFCVNVVRIAEPFETLVDKNVMNDEIGESISKNPQPHSQSDFQDIILPQKEKPDTDQGIENKKSVIPFKPGIVVFFMMVGMQVPQKTVHDKFVAEPCHEFHKQERQEKNKDIDPHGYNIFNL